MAGQRLEVSASAPQIALSEAREYLIQNTFNKMSYLKTLCDRSTQGDPGRFTQQ